LHCNAVRRVYAARGLQLADVIHILVDAAVGAIYMSQDHGARAAILAAKQLFRSRPEAADVALRVCRALFAHASSHEQPPLHTADRGGSTSRRSPLVSSGGVSGVGSCSRTTSGGGVGGAAVACGSRMSQPQRAQLADDAASVEVALQIRMLGASSEEMQACTPAIVGVRSWVQRLASAACDGPSVGKAAAAGLNPGLMGQEIREDRSTASSLSSPDETTVYDNAHSPRYPTAGHGHGDSLASGEGSSDVQPSRSPGHPAAAACPPASPPDSSTNSTASRAGSMSAPDLSESGPNSVTESKSKTKSKERRVPSQCAGPGRSNRTLQVPETSFSPGHSPVRQSISNSLRRSIDRLKRWVSSRRSHEGFAVPVDAEAQIMLPVRMQTPMQHGDGSSGGGAGDAAVAGGGGSRGGFKAWQRSAQSFVAPYRQSPSIIDNHSNKLTSPSSPPPPPPPQQQQQQQEPQQMPRIHPITPPRAQPQRGQATLATATGAAMSGFGSPSQLQPCGSGGLGPSQALTASSPATPAAAARLASTSRQSPAVDIIARIPVIHSPCQGQAVLSCSGGHCGGAGGIGRYLATSGRTTPERHGVRSPRYPISIIDTISPAKVLVKMDPEVLPGALCGAGAAAAATAANSGTNGAGGGADGDGDGHCKLTVAPSRRSMLRSGVLAAPLRLLRRRERRVMSQEVRGS
ncbi:hypothetical protein Vretimale_9755, partial [Volvox reticuliferus]